MGALVMTLGLLLFLGVARSDEAPKGPKVTHKVRVTPCCNPTKNELLFFVLIHRRLKYIDHSRVADPAM